MKFSYSIKDRLTPRHDFIEKFCGNLKGERILDIGCSFGWLEQFALKEKASEAVGIEPEEKLFFNARQEVPQAKFIIGRAEKLPFRDRTFDKVIMLEVLEHLLPGREEKAFAEANRVLAPSGTFILSTPNFGLLNILLDPAWFLGHRHYRLSWLKKELVKAGFKIEKVFFYGGFWEMFRMIPHYIFKWILRREDPFKSFFEKKMALDQKKEGTAFIYIRAVKK